MCLHLAGVKPQHVDAVAVAGPVPDSDFYAQLRAQFPSSRLSVVEHHLAHAASAYFASPFEEANVLTLDRGGDFRCGARWRAQGSRMTLEQEYYAPDSPGDLYGRVTELLGLEANSDEHKVQWMSMRGDDRYKDLFLEILALSDNGPRLDRSYLTSERSSRGGFSARFYERLGLRPEEAEVEGVPDALR